MAKIRKRNKEELKKEEKYEEKLKNQRRIDKAFTLNGVIDKDWEERDILYKGVTIIKLKVFGNGEHSMIFTDAYRKQSKLIQKQLDLQAEKLAEGIKRANNWPAFKGASALVNTGDLLDPSELKVGVDMAGVSSLNSIPVRIDPNLKDGDMMLLSTNPDGTVNPKNSILMSGRKSGKTQALNAIRKSLGFPTLSKGRSATASVADDLCSDEEMIQNEIKRGEAAERSRKKVTVHFVKEKYLNKDYEFNVYYESGRVIDIKEPKRKSITSDDIKFVHAFAKILRNKLSKLNNKEPPLSITYRDTIMDEYILENL